MGVDSEGYSLRFGVSTCHASREQFPILIITAVMSYNVTHWKTKELSDLQIPIASLFKHERTDLHPYRKDLGNEVTKFSFGEVSITGVVNGNWLHVTKIYGSGECSGSAMDFFLEPALADSRGRLVAARVWEGGEYLDLLTVIDGVVTKEPIEI